MLPDHGRFVFVNSNLLTTIIGHSNNNLPIWSISLDIPSPEKCTTCDFNWASASHYGYSFIINTDPSATTLDLDTSQLITFSAIHINYKGYNSSDPNCNVNDPTDPPFLESYNYQIGIYHHDGLSFVSKATKSGEINRENTPLNTISLIDGTTSTVTLTSGEWYVGLRLSWKQLSQQQCDC